MLISTTVKLNREINHENIVALKEVILEDKSIYMVFEYAEHDFLVSQPDLEMTLYSEIFSANNPPSLTDHPSLNLPGSAQVPHLPALQRPPLPPLLPHSPS